ncbi:hypothetical protein [Fannyhessea vaginae]|uniref:hypothetical protein n=1 Tax=Fannyhessea vaginae TaxID=82135 RepID=UPI0023F46D4D|nr:hypothetical protein [Fannyhessea vaginae]
MSKHKYLHKTNESEMKGLLAWLEEFNESKYKLIIDPVGVVNGVALSGRYLRQLLFNGQFDFYEIVESENNIILGILVVAKSEVIKLRATSLILFVTNHDIDLSNCFVYKGDALYVMSIAVDIEKYLAVGFKNVAQIPSLPNSLNYLYLSVETGD